MAAITPSSGVGGSVLIDGRYVWLIAYTGGAGVVPAFNTAITSGSGATGKLIGVYSALNAAPATPGAAMPATGWIKVKQWNETLYGAGALTGITATAATEDVGWLEVVGEEGARALFSSLTQAPSGDYDGSFIKGDWYTVGTTDGNRATSYQIPTNGSAVWHGGVMVDRAAATAITAASWSAGVATFTSTSHGLATDDLVMVDAILPRTWRTVDTQRCTVVDANTFTVPMTVDPGSYTSGGTVAAQEWWPVTDTVNTKVGTEDYRGKHCWLDSATGLLRFGNDNVTSTGGALPATGRVIRLPNVTTQSATVATKTANALTTTIANRWRYYNSNAAVAKVDHVSGAWAAQTFQTGKYVSLRDSSFVNQIGIATQSAPSTIWNCCVGGNGNTTSTTSALLLSVLYASAPVTVTDTVISTGEVAARFPASLTTVYGISFDRCRFTTTGDRSSTYCVNFNIGRGATFTNCQFGPNGIATSSQFSDVTMSDCTFYSASYGRNLFVTTPTINLTNLSSDHLYDSFTGVGTTPLQRTSLVTLASGSDRTNIRNWGTFASPIDMRFNGNQLAMPWTRVTTTATVTETAHPYLVGDQVAVWMSSSTAAITLATKTITAITANTFSFTCLNAGAASGTLSYYVGGSVGLFNLSGVADTTIQNVHVRGNTGTPVSTTITQYGMTLQNVTVEPQGYSLVPILAANDMQSQSVYGPDYPLVAAQTAVFGTHFSDLFVREPGTAVPGQVAAVTGVSWTRSSSLITVTSPDHGLTGQSQRLWIENSSDPTAIANGWEPTNFVSANTLLPIDKDTFTFTGVNSGATSGTLDYWVAGDSQFRILMMEESSDTAGQAEITATSGGAGFTGAGTLVLPAVGDQVTWTQPSFMLGYDSFGHTPAIPYGTGLSTFITTRSFDIEYQLDRGSGFSGTWRNAAYWRTGAGGTAATTTVTMTDTTGVQVNDYVFGIGIAAGAQVVSIDSATDITVTVANDATVSGTLGFWYTPNETAFPSTGVRMMVRCTANAVNTSAFYQIDFPLLSSSASRARLYEQAVQAPTLSITGLPVGTTVALYDDTDGELAREDAIATGEFEYQYIHSGTDIPDVYFVVWHPDYLLYRSAPFDLTADDLGLSFTPIDDTLYDAAADVRYTFDFPNKLIVMDTGETVYDVRGAYSCWKDEVFLLDNLTEPFAFDPLGYVEYSSGKWVPAFTELINGWKIRPDEANHTLTVEGGILYATASADPFVDTLGAYTVRIAYAAPVDVLALDTGGGAAPTASEVADAVWDESLAGHSTAGTAGKLLTDVEATGDITQAKVNNL